MSQNKFNKTRNLELLIVEDDEISDLLITLVAKKIFVKILHATTGNEAIEICQNNPDIVLILMDIKLSKMEGHIAAQRIKEFRPDLPIIAQTAYALEHERAKYNGVWFDDYITKPIDENDLKIKLEKYC